MNYFRKNISCCFAIFIICCFMSCESTKCKPLSPFRIDCNTCRCSASGREYNCTQMTCIPGYYGVDSVLLRKIRQFEIPFINDEISISSESQSMQEEPSAEKIYDDDASINGESYFIGEEPSLENTDEDTSKWNVKYAL